MDKIGSAIRYVTELKKDKIDHGDMVAIKLAKLMGWLHILSQIYLNLSNNINHNVQTSSLVQFPEFFAFGGLTRTTSEFRFTIKFWACLFAPFILHHFWVSLFIIMIFGTVGPCLLFWWTFPISFGV